MIIPKNSYMVSHLLVVEYMTPEGELVIESESHGSDNEELEFGKLLQLLEHAKIEAVAPYLAYAVAQYCVEENEQEEEEEEEA